MKAKYRHFMILAALGLGVSLGMSMLLFLASLVQDTPEHGVVAASDAASRRSLALTAPNVTTTPAHATAPNSVAMPTQTCGPITTWTPGPARSPARYAAQGALATDNNPRFTPAPSFYVVGGLTASNTPLADVSRYSPTQNFWSQAQPLPVATGRLAIGGASYYIYAAGGYLGGTGPDSVTDVMRIYNSQFNSWSTYAPMPSRVEAAAGTVLNGKFYVIGGDNYTNTLSTNYIYDIGSNTWSTGAPLPAPRKNAYATAQGGLVYFFGGLDAAGQATDTFFAYNPITNNWTTLASPNTGGLGNYAGISSYGAGFLIALDGGTPDDIPGGMTHIYEIANNAWVTGPALITARMGMAQGTLSDGRVIVYGGLTSPGNVTSSTEFLWSPCPVGTTTPTWTWTPTRTPTPTFTPMPIPPCGLAFRRVNGPNPGSDDYLYRVAAIAANDVWTVGRYVSGGQQQPLMQHWDGTSWTTFYGPITNNGGLSDVTALSSNDVWAVGKYGVPGSSTSTTLVEHWNGTQWSIVPSPNVGTGESELSAVAAVAANDVWAVGDSGSYPNYYTLIEHWNGTQWSIVSSPSVGNSSDLSGVAVVAANDVWAVGSYHPSGVYQTLAEHWNGTQWSIVSTPNPSSLSGFRGVAAIRGVPNAVWAAGFNGANSGIDLIERWDGTQWNVIPNTPYGWLNGITAISVNDVWAVGYTYFGGNFPHAIHWNGSVWSTVTVPAYSNSEVFYGVGGALSSDVWAVGNDHWTYASDRHTLIQRYYDPCLTRTVTPTPSPTCLPLRIAVGQNQPATPSVIHSNKWATHSFALSGKETTQNSKLKTQNSSDAPITFALDDGSSETSIGFGIDTTESAALWLNRFTPPANAYPITLSGIQILWPDQSGAGDNLPGKTARLVVYQDADGDGNPSNATLLGQLYVTISSTEVFENYPVNIVAPGPSGDIYIGFEDLWAEAGYTPRMYPAAQDTTASQARSWIAAMGSGAPPDVNNLGNNDQLATIDSFNIPGNWMIRATGNTQAGGCPPTRTPTNTPTRTSTPTPTPTCPPVRLVVGQNQPAIPRLIHTDRDATSNFAPAKRPGANNNVPTFQRSNVPTIDSPITFMLDDGAEETSIGFGAGATESAALWLNRFTPPSGSYPIAINGIQVLWPDQSATGDNLPGKTARLLVYQDADGDGNPSNAMLVGQLTVTIGITETYENYPVNITVPGPTGDLYIGFEDLWAEQGHTPRMYPAAQDTTTSQARSWLVGMGNGAPPNIDNLGNNDVLGTIDSFNLPGNWMIRATGNTQAGGCPPTRTPTSTPTSCAVDYAYATSTATIVPGTDLVPGSQCSSCVVQVSLPFLFTFYGQIYSTVNVGTDGNLQFTTTYIANHACSLPVPGLGPAMMPHWSELDTRSSGGIYTSVSGSTPNRIFNIEWRACYRINCSRPMHFEARLHESTGVFDFLLDETQLYGCGYYGTIGIQDGSSAYRLYSCNVSHICSSLMISWTPTQSCTTPTPTPVPALIGHVVWQGPPNQPDSRQQLPVTLTLKLGANETDYPPQTTDSNGYFAVSLFGLPSGTYNWRAKGPKYLANSGTVQLGVRRLERWNVGTLRTNNVPTFQRSNLLTISVDMGMMRAGDANNDNVIGSADFNIMKATFGKSVGDPGYDPRADFNNDNVVNLPDFNLLKTNFGQGGAPPISPGGGGG